MCVLWLVLSVSRVRTQRTGLLASSIPSRSSGMWAKSGGRAVPLFAVVVESWWDGLACFLHAAYSALACLLVARFEGTVPGEDISPCGGNRCACMVGWGPWKIKSERIIQHMNIVTSLLYKSYCGPNQEKMLRFVLRVCVCLFCFVLFLHKSIAFFFFCS